MTLDMPHSGLVFSIKNQAYGSDRAISFTLAALMLWSDKGLDASLRVNSSCALWHNVP
jgi:hypothetical protein